MKLAADALVPVKDPDACGDLRMWPDTQLPGLGRRADIMVWLPPDYDTSEQTYPVVYMHDADNLFLPSTSFAGETWRVGETMTALANEGIAAIIIGIPNHPTDRLGEYTQYPHPEHGGGHADKYAKFLVHKLKPAVDAVLRTDPGPESTVVAGSSLGAIVSAYLWERYPDVFGAAGLFSTSFWFPGPRALADFEYAAMHPRKSARIYMDVGGHEGSDLHDAEAQIVTSEQALRVLRASDVPVLYVYDSVAEHNEAAWARRFPAAMRWLLRDWAV